MLFVISELPFDLLPTIITFIIHLRAIHLVVVAVVVVGGF
jgi:hypothetical protein